jgi:hypothetical protein
MVAAMPSSEQSCVEGIVAAYHYTNLYLVQKQIGSPLASVRKPRITHVLQFLSTNAAVCSYGQLWK